ncbi:DUF397 domain-containing protein [Micromonospora sp. KC723]|uniref:DUF397 domain-containing protein n=1 Tax=Micromonospora sp. KC723 TaxID=2530381 RepID=UPI00104AE985|nr:DUF397 domain-containing protein [Micromonospora sp. KC723]TDB75850.1 DUF397 domain-containing protein [Micromonospora sp. KC723]
MREQCEHRAACVELPTVEVHVVPQDTGMYPGLGGPFTDNLPGAVLVRDTKDRDGGTVVFTPEAWRGFVAFAKTSR